MTPGADGVTASVDASSSLGRNASGALGWRVLNTLVSKFGTLPMRITLARLLGPDFGTYAVAIVALLPC